MKKTNKLIKKQSRICTRTQQWEFCDENMGILQEEMEEVIYYKDDGAIKQTNNNIRKQILICFRLTKQSSVLT